jgi:hypothetical protein
MNAQRNFGIRFWSLALAFLIPIIEISIDFHNGGYEVRRAMVAIAGIVLLTHSWIMQRKNVGSRWRLAFWTMLLTLFALGFLWLGLNSIRGSTYPDDPNAANLAYWFAVEWQDRIIVLAKIAAAAVGIWIAIDLILRFTHREMNERSRVIPLQKSTSEKPRS